MGVVVEEDFNESFIGIDSGANGGACVLYPDKAAFAAPIGT
ncbi:MAG: hypothetical protein ACLUKN_01390 [Bacilli bacterium]